MDDDVLWRILMAIGTVIVSFVAGVLVSAIFNQLFFGM